MFPFYTPRIHQKISGLLMFSGGIDRENWEDMGNEVITLLQKCLHSPHC